MRSPLLQYQYLALEQASGGPESTKQIPRAKALPESVKSQQVAIDIQTQEKVRTLKGVTLRLLKMTGVKGKEALVSNALRKDVESLYGRILSTRLLPVHDNVGVMREYRTEKGRVVLSSRGYGITMNFTSNSAMAQEEEERDFMSFSDEEDVSREEIKRNAGDDPRTRGY